MIKYAVVTRVVLPTPGESDSSEGCYVMRPFGPEKSPFEGVHIGEKAM